MGFIFVPGSALLLLGIFILVSDTRPLIEDLLSCSIDSILGQCHGREHGMSWTRPKQRDRAEASAVLYSHRSRS